VVATRVIVYAGNCVKRKPTRTTPRREKALATRRRMLRAAYDLFCGRGYAGTTMELVAERAGVAVQTVYFTFHTKGAVLEEALGAAILGFDRWDPRAEAAVSSDPRKAFTGLHPWFPRLERTKTAKAALAVFVDASVEILARVSPLVVVMTTMSGSDSQVGATAAVAERRRVDAYAFAAELIAKRGKLRPRVTLRRATDVLLTILSAETYQHLAVRRRWSTAACRKWFLQVLSEQLLA